MVGPNAKRAAVNEAEFVVREIDVLEALPDEGVAVNLVDVTVAQVERHNVVVRIAQRTENLNEGVVAQIERRHDGRLVLEDGRRVGLRLRLRLRRWRRRRRRWVLWGGRLLLLLNRLLLRVSLLLGLLYLSLLGLLGRLRLLQLLRLLLRLALGLLNLDGLKLRKRLWR